MRTHEEIIQAQDAILAETQKWMKMAKFELNHKREVVADREKTILNQAGVISAMDQKIDEQEKEINELEEEINELKEALLNMSTTLTELSMENAKLSIYKTLVDQSIIHVRR